MNDDRIRAAREQAWREGFNAGWASSGEGWNGEYTSTPEVVITGDAARELTGISNPYAPEARP